MYFFGCGSSIDDRTTEPQLTSAAYGGADPKGDFIAIKINGSARTVTHYNYTPDLDEVHGPYSHSKATDSSVNGGFSTMYMTEVFPDAVKHLCLFYEDLKIYNTCGY